MQAEFGDQAIILGVDVIGDEPFQELITDTTDLPWLQDVPDVGAWELWGVEWRDVWVLDAEGYLVGINNLSNHDLADGDAYAEMKGMILEATR